MNRRRIPRYGRLLILIVAVYVVVIASGPSRVAGLLRLALLAVILLTAMRIRGAGGSRTALAVGIVVGALVAGGVAYRLGSGRLSVSLVSSAVLVLVIASMVVILRELWHRPVVDVHTVAGALTVYLLLAQLFATVHQLCAALFGLPYLNGVPSVVDASKYLYFSVITLATVGYGDITPASDTARAVAMAEALVGQLYLVAVVGTVVGNISGTRRPAPDSSARDEAGAPTGG